MKILFERLLLTLCLGLFLANTGFAAHPVKPCGGLNQRACCLGEKSFGACKRGYTKKHKRNSGWCKPFGLIQARSQHICIRKTRRVVKACGGLNQRACCLLEKKFGACKRGLVKKHKKNSGWCKGTKFQSQHVCVRKAKRVVKACGGLNQRACCLGEKKFGACKKGLKKRLKRNAGWCKRGPVGQHQSQHICVNKFHAVGPCGGLNQRACCLKEKSFGACKPGMFERPKRNSGWCKPGPFGQFQSNGICKIRVTIKEPGTGWRRPRKRAKGLTGYADLHTHIFAHMAHGGKVLAGKPYHNGKGGVNLALASCKHKHGFPHVMLFNNASTIGGGTKDMNGPSEDHSEGSPSFRGWPKWHSTIHQQMYYRWLKRAWKGGLRLIVEHAVTNEALCRSTKARRCTDSMYYIKKQIRATRAFANFIKRKDGGWFRIVKTPAEARRVIKQGYLAVIQGIEVDNLFNCKRKKQGKGHCTAKGIRKKLDYYYRQGVRHIFPIHNFDNAFGGPATWQDMIEVGNKVVEGNWWNTGSCPKVKGKSYGFKLGDGALKFTAYKTLGGKGFLKKHRGRTSCNRNGLTSLGRSLITGMMDRGMIIDVDHMSRRSFNDTMRVTRKRKNYPVVASHVQFFSLNKKSIRHERMRTGPQLRAIAKSGGMIAVMTKDDQQDTDNKGKQFHTQYKSNVRNGCTHSSTTWAQMVQYAVDVTGGPVALGSDFNGVAGHIGPRFGKKGCGGNKRERSRQRAKLRYPFTIPGFGTFTKQKTGRKTFDYNYDGLAHVGLLPDLIADLRNVGLPSRYTKSLMGSAEKYIQVWERACKRSKNPKKCLGK